MASDERIAGLERAVIFQRIDLALEKMRFRQMEVRAIYLDEEDRDEFDRANTRMWQAKLGSKAKFFATTYREHPLRNGEKSRIYSTHGVETVIRKRLPKRTQLAEAA